MLVPWGRCTRRLLGDAGNEVWAIDVWKEHVEAIQEHGLRLEGASGDRTVRINATTDAAQAGVCDLVIIATKGMHVESAAGAARQLVGPDTLVLPIQNGLGGPDAVARVLGEERVAIGVVGGFGASVVGPGHARHEGWELVRLGERSGPATPRVERIADVWRDAGFRVQTYDDVGRLVWEKLVCNVSFSGPCTLLECTLGDVLASEPAWEISSRCAAEAYETGRASGIAFSFDEPVAYVHAFALADTSRAPLDAPRLPGRTARRDRLHQRSDSTCCSRGRSRGAHQRDRLRTGPSEGSGHAGRARRRPKRRLVAAGSRLKPLLRPHVDVGDQPAEVLAGVGQGVRGLGLAGGIRRKLHEPARLELVEAAAKELGGGAREGSAGAG